MVYMGEGSDWNYETDGIPGCICEIGVEIHTPEELWEIHEEQKVIADSKSPATGEAPVLGICGALVIVLAGLVLVCKRMRVM